MARPDLSPRDAALTHQYSFPGAGISRNVWSALAIAVTYTLQGG